MRLHGSGEQKARHRKGAAHKSDKAMLADAAVGKRLFAADKHIGGTTGKRATGEAGVLGTRLVTATLILPVLTSSVSTSDSEVSRPIMPKGASSNSRTFSHGVCGA